MTDDLRAKIAELRQRRKTAAESWGSEEKPGSAFLSYVAFASDIAPLLAAEAERLGAENERLRAVLRDVERRSQNRPAWFRSQEGSSWWVTDFTYEQMELCRQAILKMVREVLEGKP